MTPELDSSQSAEASEFSALDEDLEALLAAIDEGEGDLLDALDPTAAGAGPGGGAEGGHSFVMLGRIAEQVSPLSFDYGMGQLAAIDFPEDVAQELEEGEDFGVSISGLTLEEADLTVDEANLGNGSNPDAGALIQTGSFTISAPDGIATLSVGGAFIVQNGVLQSLPSITTEAGNVLAITGYTNNGDGTYTVEYSYTLNSAKDHSAPGDDSSLDQVFVVNVVDTDGDSATANLTIAVLDDGPVATDDSVTQAAENQLVDIDVFDNDTAGADGVNLATGVALVADSLTGAGSLVYNEDGTFTYTPAAGEEGEVSFQYTITDADGDSDTATATITLQDNSQPTVSVVLAQGDDGVVSESTLPDGSGGGDLTASGTLVAETGNDMLDFFEVQDVNGAWIKVDADGTEVQGEYGLLSVNQDGSWTYTLSDNTLDHEGEDLTGADDQVQDAFQVRATDSDGDVSPEATLAVDINDDGPVATDDSVTQAAENQPIDIDVFDNDTSGADGVNLATGVALVADSLTGAGSLVYNEDGTFTYTPAAGEEGEVSFQYTITDADGDSDTATATITLQDNSQPTVSVVLAQGDDGVVSESALPDGSGGGDLTASGTLVAETGNDTLDFFEVQDVNGAWIKVDADGTEVQGEYGLLSVNQDGSWTYTLSDNTLDHEGEDLTGADDQVQDAFQVRATDSDGDVSPEATLAVDINDDGPVATDDSVTQAAENQPVDIDVFDNDTAGADGVNLATGVALVADSLTGAGSLVYNEDGTFTYTPAAGEEGEVSFQYTITDADGDSDTATATITLQDNSQPTVSVVLAQGDDGVVSESALPDGSGGGDLTASGTLVAETGNDMLDFFEVQDVNGAWIKVDADGTEVQGEYGLLSVNQDGSWTYTLSDNTLDHEGEDLTGADDQVQDAFQVRATDSDGDVSPEATLAVDINDDGPVEDVRNVVFQNSAGFSFEGTAVQMGADQQGAELNWTQAPTGLFYEGALLQYEGVGTNVLAGYVGEGDDRVDVLKPTGNPDCSYLYEQFQPIDLVTAEIRGFPAGDFNEAGGPEPNIYILEDGSVSRSEPGEATPWAVEISGIGGSGGNADQINSNSNGFGVGNPSFDSGESVTFDFDISGESGSKDLFSSASIEFSASSGIKMNYVVTYSDGSELVGTFYQADLENQTFTFDAPSGLFLDSIVLVNDGSSTQITGFGVSQIVELIDEGLPFDLGFEAIDGDGDVQDGIIDFFAEPGETLDASGQQDGLILVGSEGDNILLGGEGDDILYGGAGDDTITGGSGNDTIIGGAGDDELTGGGGNNVFVWHLGDQGTDGSVATDTVTDFTLDGDGADKLVLSDLLQDMEPTDDLSSYLHAEADGDNTLLHISAAGELSVEEGSISGADQVIVLNNVDMGDMDSGQFLQSLIESGQLDIE